MKKTTTKKTTKKIAKKEATSKEPINIEMDNYKPMSRKELHAWRTKRLTQEMVDVQIDIPDFDSFVEALNFYDMSPSEYCSFALEKYIEHFKK